MKQINFKKKINWWKINFDLKSVNYIKNSIKQKNVSQGLVTKKLENKFSKVLKIKYVTMTNNGSVALLMSLLSLNLKKDEEVILQNRTWISSANAIYFIGAKIKIVDVHFNMQACDIKEIFKAITKKTKVIIITHMNGNFINLDYLNKIKKKFPKIKIIEDASQALFSKYKNKYLGTFGDIGCFSLSVAKLLSTGQGGFIVTNNKKIDNFLKKFRSHSQISNTEQKFNSFGFNFRFNDILSSFGLFHLQHIKKKKQNLIKIYQLYEKELSNLKKIKIVHRCHSSVIPVYIECLVDNRKKFCTYLLKHGIETRKFYNSLNSVSYLKKILVNKNHTFKNSKIFEKKGVYLPSGPDQNIKDIQFVIKIIRSYDSK